jgi:apolipoprotein N-acyltransferase
VSVVRRTWLAIAAGIGATVLAYPPVGFGLAAFLMLAPIAAVIDGARPRRAFLAVWIYSAGFALVLVRWLVSALADQYGVDRAAAWLFTTGLIGALALVPAAAGALFAALSPRVPPLAAPVAFAAIWVFGEWLRSVPLGVPWLLAAQPLVRWPLAIQTADVGGTHAVGFVVVAAGAGLGLAARRRSPLPLVLPAVLVAAALAYGALRLATVPSAAGERSGVVGVVQASVPQVERFRPGSAARNVALHVQATRALAAREPVDLVVWSETAVDIDLDETPALRAVLAELATTLGVPIVTGAPRSDGGRRSNAVVLFAPGRGLTESYAKQRLVPFSEYDPAFGGVLAPLLGPVTEGDPYVPGTLPTVFRGGPLPFAAAVCFEVTYPDLARRFRAEGAELLVNLSNDAWFGAGGYPEMHLGHAILRAVELRSWVVRGANTGISAAVDPAGRVVEELPAFTAGSFAVAVAEAGPPPLYALAGDAPVLSALGLALAASLASRGRREEAPARARDRSARARPAARARAGRSGSTG